MQTISSYLTSDHRRCDNHFAAAEAYTAEQDWAAATTCFEQFLSAMTRHFEIEEQVLFPAFEQRTGSVMGPTRMMRMEHEQMRELFERMADAIAARNADEYAGLSETLLIMLQQHNFKEEQVLYPMSDQALGTHAPALIQQMEAVSSGVEPA